MESSKVGRSTRVSLLLVRFRRRAGDLPRLQPGWLRKSSRSWRGCQGLRFPRGALRLALTLTSSRSEDPRSFMGPEFLLWTFTLRSSWQPRVAEHTNQRDLRGGGHWTRSLGMLRPSMSWRSRPSSALGLSMGIWEAALDGDVTPGEAFRGWHFQW